MEAEVQEFLEGYQELRDGKGRQRVVRNGYLPEREIQTGIGGIPVRVPRVRDREEESTETIRFRSSLVPPYLRRSKSVEELLPLLYLKGISTGDFSEALSALLGPDAPGLSAQSISRLKQRWKNEYEGWRRRDPESEALRVLVGRRHLQQRAHGGRSALPADPDGRQSRRQEGADRGGRRLSGKRAVLVGAVERSAFKGAEKGTQAGGGRRRPGLLESDGQGLRQHPSATVLDAQDGQRPQLPAQGGAAQGQEGFARDLDGRNPGRGSPGL